MSGKHESPVKGRQEVILHQEHAVSLLILSEWEGLQRTQVIIEFGHDAGLEAGHERARSVSVVRSVERFPTYEAQNVLLKHGGLRG